MNRRQISITKIRVICLMTCTLLIYQNAFSAAYQIFTNIAYDNPAKLNTVKNVEAIAGGTFLEATFVFKGANGPLVGTAKSNAGTAFPYGRYAVRINPKLVFGIDITSYQFADIEYPQTSILSTLSTATIIKSYDISPRISYQLTPTVSVGIGVLADRIYKSSLNFVVPPNEFTNDGIDWAYGWTLGLSYKINETNTFNLSYLSALRHNPRGRSTWGALYSDNYRVNANLPAVLSFNLTHIFNPKWMLNTTIRYAFWDIVRGLNIQNSALGTIYFPQNKFNNWMGQLTPHYQLNDKWGFSSIISYETNSENTPYRPVGLPTYSRFSLGVGSDYAINKELSLKLLYGHSWSNPNINTTGPIGPVIGNIHVNGNLLDLSLSYRT